MWERERLEYSSKLCIISHKYTFETVAENIFLDFLKFYDFDSDVFQILLVSEKPSANP